MIDTSLKALKPDITVSKEDHELIGGEVKKPKHKYFTVYTDLSKLGFELKHMLDHHISVDPCKQVYRAGILVEGLRCTTFKMDLAYNGIYRFIELAQFNLLLNTDDLLSANHPYERVCQFEDLTRISYQARNSQLAS